MPMDSSLLPEFRELAAAHLESAYNLARWLVRDRALADDVVQDAMLRALRYYHGFRGENARAWLLQIVRNVAMTRLKRGSEEAAGDANSTSAALEVAHDGPETALMRQEEQRLLHDLLGSLPVELRECLILREIEELSYKEIARVVGAPIGTVMSRLWRGRKLLVQAAARTTEAV
jgi:RNA polymerase sigma-70 factor (ECF subfamily)